MSARELIIILNEAYQDNDIKEFKKAEQSLKRLYNINKEMAFFLIRMNPKYYQVKEA